MTTIHRGVRGPEVRRLKDLLEGAGIQMTRSDNFDLLTEIGVRILQEKRGLEKDGIVGPNTWKEVLQPTRLYSQAADVIDWLRMGPYYPQRDNEYSPGGTCNVTSLAMVLGYHGVEATEAEQLEDELYLRLQKPDAQAHFDRWFGSLKNAGYKPRHIHGMLGWLAGQYGFNWKFSDSTTWTEMSAFGKSVGPMITSGSFTGYGHIIVITGMTITGDLIVHDPWGNWDRGYQFDTNGQYKIYNREAMQQVLSGNSSTRKRTHQIVPKGTLV